MIFRVRTWGGIGDVLLLTPALRALKQTYPQAKLEVFCEQQPHFDLLKHNPHIDRLRMSSQGRLARLGAAQMQSVRSFLKLKPYLVGTDYGSLSASLTRRHATELIAELLNVQVTDRKLDIFLTPEEEDRARALLNPYADPVTIHVTSHCSVNQNWPWTKWEALVQRNPHYTFLQVGMPDETPICGAVDLRGKTTLRESIALLKYSKSFVGVVSSMAHATNAVGTPGVVLFGPSAPEVWGHSNNKTITKKLRCAPCIDFLRGVECPYRAPCLSEITVEEVETALREQMTRPRNSCSEAPI